MEAEGDGSSSGSESDILALNSEEDVSKENVATPSMCKETRKRNLFPLLSRNCNQPGLR